MKTCWEATADVLTVGGFTYPDPPVSRFRVVTTPDELVVAVPVATTPPVGGKVKNSGNVADAGYPAPPVIRFSAVTAPVVNVAVIVAT